VKNSCSDLSNIQTYLRPLVNLNVRLKREASLFVEQLITPVPSTGAHSFKLDSSEMRIGITIYFGNMSM
jgi:hypothetical protein